MKESDIRPQDLFNRYLELVRHDNETLFADRTGFIDIACPACGGSDIDRRFTKDGFEYCECTDCRSLYQSPRPDENTLARFYREAESVKFWGTEFYRQTAEARREKLFKPRLRLRHLVGRSRRNRSVRHRHRRGACADPSNVVPRQRFRDH